jgi:hypothetical protein
MAISIRCGGCGRKFRARDEHEGRQGTCPGCGRELVVAGPRVPTYDVFLSYSSKDKTVADVVCGGLEKQGLRCWMAPRDIRAGADWGSAIVEAIGDSAALVLLYTGHANHSRQVLREVERAVSKDVAVIPLRLEDVPPSKTLEYFISSSHWMDAMGGPLEEQLAKLAESVRPLLGHEAPGRGGPRAPGAGAMTSPPPPTTTSVPPATASLGAAPASPGAGRKMLLLGVAAGVAMAVVVGGIVLAIAGPRGAGDADRAERTGAGGARPVDAATSLPAPKPAGGAVAAGTSPTAGRPVPEASPASGRAEGGRAASSTPDPSPVADVAASPAPAPDAPPVEPPAADAPAPPAAGDGGQPSAAVIDTSGVETKFIGEAEVGSSHTDFRNYHETLFAEVKGIYYQLGVQGNMTLTAGAKAGEFTVTYRWNGRDRQLTGTCEGGVGGKSEFGAFSLPLTKVKRLTLTNHAMIYGPEEHEKHYAEAKRTATLSTITLTDGRKLAVARIEGDGNPNNRIRYSPRRGESYVTVMFTDLKKVEFAANDTFTVTLKSGTRLSGKYGGYRYYRAASEDGLIWVPAELIRSIEPGAEAEQVKNPY